MYLLFPLDISRYTTATITAMITMIISSMTTGITMAVVRSALQDVSSVRLEAKGPVLELTRLVPSASTVEVGLMMIVVALHCGGFVVLVAHAALHDIIDDDDDA